ncbi:MAG TPA: HDOD domain-containing protein [Burkholderiales bacterium]|nr:HDOD domain-containing protein [Burkholderiales bacterium]
MKPESAPQKVGRYDIERATGAGGAYLARDPREDRKVLVRLFPPAGKAADGRRTDIMLAESRLATELAHPNVVALLEAGEDGGLPYLVFENAGGTPLAQVIARERRLAPKRAAAIAADVLAALRHAHAHGVMHRDLRVGSILLDAGGGGRVLDFGVAPWVAQEPTTRPGEPRTLSRHLAPEYLLSGRYTPQCDVYAAGMLLYEMLAGGPVPEGDETSAARRRAAGAGPVPPSQFNAAVDAALDALVLRALAADPDKRFDGAGAMRAALRTWADPAAAPEEPEPEAGGPPERLLRRMRLSHDFPALSYTISTISRVAGSEDENVSALSNIILRDFALTNKLLRLVNTAYFGQYGGTISTVSRAVVILGFDRVRSAAMALMLMEQLQDDAQVAQLREDVVAGYYGGLLARELVSRANVSDAEEVFVCTMFQGLGRLLVRFYLPQETRQIDRLVEDGLPEEQAAPKVLGLGYDDIGVGAARAWNFPERMVQSMRRLTDEQVRRPETPEQRLRAVAGLAAELCATLRERDARTREKRMRALVDRFGKGLGVTRELLEATAMQCMQDLARDARAIGLRSVDDFLALLAAALGPRRPEPEAAQPAPIPTAVPEAERKAVLTAGIQDITNALVTDFRLNDILRIILETMYRGSAFARVLLCVRDPSSGTLKARFGLGAGVDDIISRGFGFPVTGTRDVFQAALASGSDVLVDDVDATGIVAHVPGWLRKSTPGKSFALFPIVVNRKPIGMLYGDADAAGALKFPAEELALLRTLRNQAVLAIRQQSA